MKRIILNATPLRWSSLLLCVFLAAAAGAQGPAAIRGKVTDTKGLPIPGAMVRVSEGQGEPLESLTAEDGSFAFENLASGVYRLVVEMPGFQTEAKDAVDTSGEASRNLAISLKAPPRIAAAPATGRARPEGSAGSGPAGFRTAEVTDLPGLQLWLDTGQLAEANTGTERQNPQDFLLIAGGGASLDAGDWNDPNFRQRMMDTARQMGFGLEIMPGLAGPGREVGAEGMPSEARPGLGQGGAVEAGRGRGAGIGMGGGAPGFFGMTAPGGGRGMMFQQPKIQGSISETYSNSGFNASPYSLTGLAVPEPLQIQNNFDITLGGVFPWIGQPNAGRRQGFRPGRGGGPGGGQPGWNFTYAGNRNRSPYDMLTTVPTDLERAGDFSQTRLNSGTLSGQPVQLYDPAFVAPKLFVNAQIPATRMNPAALALLEYIPRPNLSGSVHNYFYSRGLKNTSDQFQGSIRGIRLTSRDNIAINYSLRRGNSSTSQIFPGLDSERKTSGQNIGITGIHSFQTRLITNWRISLNRNSIESTNGFAYRRNVAADLGIAGISQDPVNWGIPTINFTNYGDLQLAAPSLNATQAFSISLGLNKIGARHRIRIGGDATWNQRNQRTDINARGTFSFTGYLTSLFDPAGRPIAGTGYDFADFLLGLPYSTTRRYGSSNNYLRNRSFNLYIEDNWRARPNLTISAGLRYEYAGPFYEKYNRLAGLDLAAGFAAAAQVFPDQAGPLSGRYFPRSLVNPDWNNVGPRIGIAWRPTAGSRFVFRTGYGVFFNASGYSGIVGQLIGQPPFAVNQDILTELSNPLTLQNGFPADPILDILNTYAVDPNYRPAYIQQWNLDIQTQISRLYVLGVGYNGSKGTGLDILRSPNRAPMGSIPGGTGIIGNVGNFTYQSNGACSILHALRVSLDRRFSRGFTLQHSYTLSKSIDGASGIGGGMALVQNDNDVAAERALSSFDQRHNFTTRFSYELPMGQNRRFLAGASARVLNLVSGWNISGDFRLSSGTPLTARILGNVSNNSGTRLGANNSERPDATGLPASLERGSRTSTQFFNTLAFAIPAPGRFGNAGRNTIPGPGTNLLNVSLRKSFRLGEYGRRVDFSWQVSNAFNHPNYGGVGTTVNSLNYGRVTSVRQMRQMSFNLRISF